MDKNGRTYQQNLVFQRLCDGVKTIESANDSLEAKASKIVAGSTGVIAAITGVNMFPQFTIELSRVDAIILALLCGSVLVMFWFAAKLWGPRPAAVMTSHDLNVLYDDYIAVPEDVAFNNALIDTAKAFEHATLVNEVKGREIRHMFIVLQAQVILLGIGVLAKVFI